MLLPSPAARAGTWTYVVTGDNSGSTYTDNGVNIGAPAYSPASSGTGPNAGTYAYSFLRSNGSSSGSGCDVKLVENVQVTFTWHPADGQTMTTDPPPPNVLVQESATAFWSANSGDAMHACAPSGNAANGLQDTEYDPPNDPNATPPVVYQTAFSKLGYSGPQPNQSYPTPKPALQPHFNSYPASSGTVTVAKRTVTTHANDTSSNWYYGFSVSVSYSASIHAQPYNFRSSAYTDVNNVFHAAVVKDDANAILALSYVWDSTDGIKADLGSCKILENVTWDTNPQGVGSFGVDQNGNKVYGPPSPPVGTDAHGNPLGYADPAVVGGPATAPGGTDTFSPDAAYMPNYSTISWWGDQTYVFSDSTTGETATPLPGPAAGTYRITRAVSPIPGTNNYGLTISSRGYSAGQKVWGHN